MPVSFRRTNAFAIFLLAVVTACGDSGGAGGETGGTGGEGATRATPVDGTLDFVATELNFHYPVGLAESDQETTNPCGLNAGTDNTIYTPLIFDDVRVNGFDLDDTVSTEDGSLCGQADFEGVDGTSGIDNAFLRVIDMIRPIRPDQIARGVLAQAPSEGLINFGVRLTGVDNLQDDDSVEVLVITTIEPPLRGTDGRIIPLASVTVDPNPEWRTIFTGRIVDGVLTTEPTDFTLGDIDLLVVEDRVLQLEDTRLRATFKEMTDGVIEVDSVLTGWWSRENMLDVIGGVVLAIGSNEGELACAFDMWADRSTDGVTCDAMSIVFESRGVSGFLTGFEQAED